MNYLVRRDDDGKDKTIEQWLGASPYSKKFVDFAYAHWDRGHPLGWAKYCWSKEHPGNVRTNG